MLLDTANLLALQFRTEGDHQSAFLPPDLTRDAPGPSWFEARIFELLKFLDRESQQVGEVGDDQVGETSISVELSTCEIIFGKDIAILSSSLTCLIPWPWRSGVIQLEF